MARRYRKYVRKPRATARGPARRRLADVGRKRSAMALGAIRTGARLGAKAAEWYKRLKVQRPQSNEDKHQVASDYHFSSRNFGTRLKPSARGKRLVVNDQRTDVFNLRNYLAWGTGYGANYLQCIQPGLPGTEVQCPLHLYDLTAVCQPRMVSTSPLREINYPATRYDLFFTNETSAGAVNFKYYLSNISTSTAVADTDASTTILSKEVNFSPISTTSAGFVQGSSTVNESYGIGSRSFLESFKAKLLFYSCRSHTTKFEVSLIQLKDDVQPDKNSVLATAFWQHMIKDSAYSPVESGNWPLAKKYMKVLKRMVFIIDSPTANDADQQARTREISFKGYLNRKLNYRWGRTADTVSLLEEDTFENAEQPYSSIQFHPHPNARVFMMIKAMVPKVAPNGPSGALATAASYDINLSTVHRNLSV